MNPTAGTQETPLYFEHFTSSLDLPIYTLDKSSNAVPFRFAFHRKDAGVPSSAVSALWFRDYRIDCCG